MIDTATLIEALREVMKPEEPKEEPHRKHRTDKEIIFAPQINIMSLNSIDTHEQTFRCKLSMRLESVNAPDVKMMHSQQPVTIDNFEPRVRFLNLVETDEWDMKSKMLDDGNMSFK